MHRALLEIQQGQWPAGSDRNSAVNPIQPVGNSLEAFCPVSPAPRGEPLGSRGKAGSAVGLCSSCGSRRAGSSLIQLGAAADRGGFMPAP